MPYSLLTPKIAPKSLIIVTIIVSVLFLASPPAVQAESNPSSESYYEIFRMEEGTAKYYVSTIEMNETWHINLTAVYRGTFYLFLFNFRPTDEYITDEGTLDPAIYGQAVAHNDSPRGVYDAELEENVSNVMLDYQNGGGRAQLFYLQIFLVSGGPDSFKMYSSNELQPYYIPFIPGFPLGPTAICLGVGSFWVAKLQKRRHQESKQES